MRRLARARGFTMVELIVSITILAIAILALVATLQSSMQLDALSREKAAVSNCAATVLEETIAQPWTTQLAATTTVRYVDVTTLTNNGTFLKPGTTSGFAKPCRVVVTTTFTTNMLRIEATVRWRSIIGKDLEVVMNSLVSKRL